MSNINQGWDESVKVTGENRRGEERKERKRERLRGRERDGGRQRGMAGGGCGDRRCER